jgi:phage major head subunit gpT-like protein
VLVIPELADEPTVWYAADTSKPIKPFVYQVRKEPQLVQVDDPKAENVFWRKKFIYGIDSRGAAGFTLPFLIARAIA